MFSGFSSKTSEFFLDIRFHNSKEFMDAHRDEYYQAVRAPFYALIEDLQDTMLQIDSDFETRPHKCLSRINRDVRFTKDKSPYRDHLWFAFRKEGVDKHGMPFYWFELSPDFTTWGLGIWGENKGFTEVLRRKLLAYPDDYTQLLNVAQASSFILKGAEAKRLYIPPGVDEKVLPLYQKKEIYFEKDHPSFKLAMSKKLSPTLKKDFIKLKPLYYALKGCVEEGMELLTDN